MASADLRAELCCSVCMDIYKDPVTLTCGHNFCQVCITRTWDHHPESEYNCPQCHQRFHIRPELQKNQTLCKLAVAISQTFQEQEDNGILCTYCYFPVPAAKSCVQCETSMCEDHLRKHDLSVEHTLISPSNSLTKRKCSIHKKILEYYCTKDNACICVSCRLDGDHQGHKVEFIDEAFHKKKNKLKVVLEKLTSKKEETHNRVQSLHKRSKELQDKAESLADRATEIFKNIKNHLKVLEKRMLEEIFKQEEQISMRVSDLIQQLEIKKDDLSKTIHHIEELYSLSDPVTVLQGQESKSNETQINTEKGNNENTKKPRTLVYELGDLHVDLISKELCMLSDIITSVKKGIYTGDSANLLLDINTAGKKVHISNDLKTLSWSRQPNNYPQMLSRFQINQVLSIQRFTSGQQYWEVETSESGDWRVGVCYPSIGTGPSSSIGNNNRSWCLHRCNNLISLAHGTSYNKYSVIHDGKYIHLPHNISCNRFRIHLDYEAGQLSFYELCNPMKHLHTFNADFTEPLHAAFYVWDKLCGKGSWVRILNKDQIKKTKSAKSNSA